MFESALLKLTSKKTLKDNVFLLEYSIPKKIEFLPGQFVIVQIRDNLKRAYSIFDASEKSIKFLIDTSPKGEASKYFDSCEIGSKVSISGPFGNFILKDSKREKVFVATGTGIAPLFSMIKKEKEKNPKNKIRVFWGTRFIKDDYLDEIFSEIDNIKLTVCLSREESNEIQKYNTGFKKYKKGYITKALDESNLDFENLEFYICGRKEIVNDVVEVLSKKSARYVYFEKY